MSTSLTATESGLVSARRIVRVLGSGEAGSHAVLFFGSPGSGKTTLATDLAKAWLCKKPTPEGACGECQPCNAFARGTAVDLLRVTPMGASRWIVKRQISPEPPKPNEVPVLAIQDFLRTSPLMSPHKVVLIEDLDRLYSDSASVFLKTLEEPPEFAKFVCTTEVVGSVMPTIVSRCLCVRCDLPNTLEAPDLEPELLALADGSPGNLQAILAQGDWYREWLAFARELLRANLCESLRLADTLRALSEKSKEEGARRQQAASLEILAGLLRCLGARPGQIDAVAEAHRRVMGNVNASFVVDSLIPQIIGNGQS